MNFSTPTLIVNKTITLNNLDKMINVANKNNLILRPHFKTHQSIEVGNWFKEKGVGSITVSSITMAEFFSSEWNDITIAFPLNILEIGKLNLMIKENRVKLLIDSISSLKALDNQLEGPAEVYLKIDVGYNRAGLKVDEKQKIKSIINFYSLGPFPRGVYGVFFGTLPRTSGRWTFFNFGSTYFAKSLHSW